MTTIATHPINQRWPASDPSLLQLYSFPTPNGIKVSAMLEETGLAYEAHTVSLGDTTTAEFLALNPNNKIPAILDPDGPDGELLALWESGAILLYLAEKTGKLLPSEPQARLHTLQWLMFQMGGVGPMFGQFGYFKVMGGKDIEDPRPRERFRLEARRLLAVLDKRLAASAYLVGDDYTLADIATWPWLRTLSFRYEADADLELDTFRHVIDWRDRCLARPASQKALNIPPRDG